MSTNFNIVLTGMVQENVHFRDKYIWHGLPHNDTQRNRCSTLTPCPISFVLSIPDQVEYPESQKKASIQIIALNTSQLYL